MYRKLGIALIACAAVIAISTGWLGHRAAPVRPPPPSHAARPGTAAGAVAAPRSIVGGSTASAPVESSGLRLEGQVLGPDGDGVGGARVLLLAAPPREVIAEADGSFVFERLRPRTYAIAAFAGNLIGGPAPIRLDDDTGPAVVRLMEGVTLAVHVVDHRGRSLSGAVVEIVDPTARAMRTDEAGTALLQPLRAGSVAVKVSAAGCATTSAIGTTGPAGTTAELTVTLHPGHAVSGHVIDERGKPIAGAEVIIAGGLGGAGTGGARVQTDAAGGFTMPALGAGSHTLLVSDGEHAPAESPPIAIADRSIDGVDIAMAEGRVVAGVVVAADRTPVPSASVRLVGGGGRNGRTTFRESTTDGQGRFELRGLPRIAMHAQAESSRAASDVVDIDLAAGEAARHVELVLEAGGAISGRVVDDHGQALAEVQVTAYRDGEPASRGGVSGSSSTMTDGSGAFSLGGLRTGTYRLFATSDLPGLRNASRGVSAATGAKDVRIALVAVHDSPWQPAPVLR